MDQGRGTGSDEGSVTSTEGGLSIAERICDIIKGEFTTVRGRALKTICKAHVHIRDMHKTLIPENEGSGINVEIMSVEIDLANRWLEPYQGRQPRPNRPEGRRATDTSVIAINGDGGRR